MIGNRFLIIFIRRRIRTFLGRKVHLKFMIMHKPKAKAMFQIYKQLMIKHIQDLKRNVRRLRKLGSLKGNSLIGKRRNKTLSLNTITICVKKIISKILLNLLLKSNQTEKEKLIKLKLKNNTTSLILVQKKQTILLSKISKKDCLPNNTLNVPCLIK